METDAKLHDEEAALRAKLQASSEDAIALMRMSDADLEAETERRIAVENAASESARRARDEYMRRRRAMNARR
jgi:hypothetical protein